MPLMTTVQEVVTKPEGGFEELEEVVLVPEPRMTGPSARETDPEPGVVVDPDVLPLLDAPPVVPVELPVEPDLVPLLDALPVGPVELPVDVLWTF